MIRAHLATFPPRRALMLDVVARMAPQVDHLSVVLNEYDDPPVELGVYHNVEAIIPDRDVKDSGKFWPHAAPDDIVFLIDDDLAYPNDYVATTLAHIDDRDLTRNSFGYQGNGWRVIDGEISIDTYMFRRAHDAVTGAGLLGTGTVCTLGRNLPTLSETEDAAGFVDVRFAHWLQKGGVLPWVLPRPFKWLCSILPREMKAQSLYQLVHRAQPNRYMSELRSFVLGWPHTGQSYSDFYARTPPLTQSEETDNG